MGDIADFYAVHNAGEIRQMQVQQQSQMRLSEFNERADALKRETGVIAKGFFAFERENPTPRQKSPYSKWVFGIAAGLLAGMASAAIPVIIGVAAVGFVLGSLIPEPEVVRMSRALDHYENYLVQTEVAAHAKARGKSVQFDTDSSPDLNLRTNHAQTVLAEREAQQAHENTRTV